jgi:hypothetical protein
MSHGRIIWSITSSQLSAQRRTVNPSHGLLHTLTGVHIVSSPSQRERHTQLIGFLTPHRGTQHSISISERNHTPNSWASSPHTGAHNVPSSSQRGTTHPSHGLSLKPTHSVYVLEDVSRSYNHQHQLPQDALLQSSKDNLKSKLQKVKSMNH